MKGVVVNRDYVLGELKKIKAVAEKDPAEARRLQADLYRTALSAAAGKLFTVVQTCKVTADLLEEKVEELRREGRAAAKAHEAVTEALKSPQLVPDEEPAAETEG